MHLWVHRHGVGGVAVAGVVVAAGDLVCSVVGIATYALRLWRCGCCWDGHASNDSDDASGCCGSGSVTW